MTVLKKLLLGLFLLNLLSCSNTVAKSDWTLATPPKAAEDPELARIHKMERIHVYNPNGGDDGKGAYEEWEADVLVSKIEEACAWHHFYYPQDGTLSCQDHYVRAAVGVASDTCALDMLYSVAGASVVPVNVTDENGVSYVLPPQNEPARLAILDKTRLYGQHLAAEVLSAMSPFNNYHPGSSVPDFCEFYPDGEVASAPLSQPLYSSDGTLEAAVPDGRSVPAIIAEALTTAERVVRTAAFDEATKMVSVAEWDRGSSDSLQLAQQRVFSRAQLSRAAAVHLLIGGGDGLRLANSNDPNTGETLQSNAFCTAAPLSSAGKRALEILRGLGISPTRVVGKDLIDELVNGYLDDGSALQRYNWLYGKQVQSLYTEEGLSANDFSEARQYLAQEINAFNRSLTASLGNIGPYQRFAGVTGAAPNRPDEYYTAIGEADSKVSYEFGEDGVPQSLSEFEATILERLEGIVEASEYTGGLGGNEETRNAFVPLSLLAQQLKQSSKLEFITDSTGHDADGPYFRVRGVSGYLAADGVPGLRILAGEDALECYLHHSVEGAPCSDANYLSLVPNSSLDYEAATATGHFQVDDLVRVGAYTNRLYLVGQKVGGNRELLASRPRYGNGQPDRRVFPEINSRAAAILRPSQDWCTRAAVECNGNLFDERLPLENELSNNSNGVEDSWRYYLDRAETAATQADQLGQQYLTSEVSAQTTSLEQQKTDLGIRERVEQHLDELQSICGVSADSKDLLALFGQNGQLEDAVAGTCQTDADCAALADGALRQCIGGACVKVPSLVVGNEDSATVAARLSECIGQDALIPYTLYGDHAVCVHDAADVCGVTPDSGCPVVVPQNQVPATYCAGLGEFYDANTMASGNWKAITSTLNYTSVAEGSAYSELMTSVNGNIASCRQIVKANKVDKGWYRLTTFSSWMSADDPTFRPCTPKSFFGNDPQHPNWGYDSALVEADIYRHQFPYWIPGYGPTGGVANAAGTIDGGIGQGDGSGTGVEITKCPDNVVPADVYGLPPALQLFLLKEAVSCNSQRLSNAVGTQILIDLPASAKAVLEEHGPLGPFPKLGGDYGQGIADLRAALVAQKDDFRLASDELNDMSTDLEKYRSEIEDNGLAVKDEDLANDKDEQEKIINDLKVQQIELDEDSSIFGTICTIAVAVAAGAATGGAGAAVVAAASAEGALGAAGAGSQKLELDRRILDAQNQIIQLDEKQHDVRKARLAVTAAQNLLTTRESLRKHSSTIIGYFTDAAKQTELVRGKLVSLEELRQKGRRALSEAVTSASPQLRQSEDRLTQATSAIADLAKGRYDEAYRNATRLAFLAKRAIETRLGVRFSELTQPLPLLDGAPATWENEICVASGLDYNKIATAGSTNLPSATLNGYVSAYVDKLKNVVDGYQLQYAFREGTDQMMVSLKDDVFNALAKCTRPSTNLLTETLSLSRGAQAGSSPVIYAPGSDNWLPFGCATGESCVAMSGLGTYVGGGGDLDRAITIDLLNSTANAGLAQSVKLTKGHYVLSWFQQADAPVAPVQLLDPAGQTVAPLSLTSVASHETNNCSRCIPVVWKRFVASYEVAVDGTFQVFISANAQASGGAVGYAVSVAAPMLESVVASSSYAASVFEGTDTTLVHSYPCADTDGTVFRNTYWEHNCERTCPQGGSSNCPNEVAVPRCYWEALFPVSLRDIELGKLFKNSGFALGNFNYRIDSLAVNVVGTGLRDCSKSTAASCNGNAFVSYSLNQYPPFTVRDQAGADVTVKLFNGSIETAKALMAERFLTNPLSSADSSLVEPYLRSEFSGRPLDGNYAIRIWDDPTVKFDSIQDVQLLLKYRYWTATK